ncbi:MAG: hypothetical protein ACJ79E_13755 [Anaeromyxobacteraceae bacterium]
MNFGTKKTLGSVLAALTTLAVVGCGGASPSTQNTATVGAAGGTVKAGSAALTIPAGALSSAVAVTVREVEAHHAGRAVRVEVELGGAQLGAPAQLAVQVDDSNGRVKMLSDDGATEHLAEVELEDKGRHSYKTGMSQSGAVEVEVEHLRACAAACAANEECDDGVCKPHVEDAVGAACDAVCASGQECDDGVCKAHGGAAGDPSVVPGGAVCAPGCATGLECDDGVCKPHGGR